MFHKTTFGTGSWVGSILVLLMCGMWLGTTLICGVSTTYTIFVGQRFFIWSKVLCMSCAWNRPIIWYEILRFHGEQMLLLVCMCSPTSSVFSDESIVSSEYNSRNDWNRTSNCYIWNSKSNVLQQLSILSGSFRVSLCFFLLALFLLLLLSFFVTFLVLSFIVHISHRGDDVSHATCWHFHSIKHFTLPTCCIRWN